MLLYGSVSPGLLELERVETVFPTTSDLYSYIVQYESTKFSLISRDLPDPSLQNIRIDRELAAFRER